MIYEALKQMADDMDRFLMLDQSNLVIRRAESLLDSAKMAKHRINETFHEWVTTYFNYYQVLFFNLTAYTAPDWSARADASFGFLSSFTRRKWCLFSSQSST